MATLIKNSAEFISRADMKIVLVDFSTGRVPTGHQEDYLLALEEALAEFDPVTIAPFRQPQRNSPKDVPVIKPDNRVERYLATYHVSRQYLSACRPALLIFHGPEFRDFIAFAVAALLHRRGGRGIGVFVMRRKGWAIVGRKGWKSWLLDATVRWMARRAPFFMVSDSRSTMDYWRRRTGVDGPVVSIPTRRPVGTVERKASDPIVVGLLGGFRVEKGAPHYDTVIDLAVADPSIEVDCQLPRTPGTIEAALAARLTSKWKTNSKVRFHIGHLDATAYVRLLYAVDIVVLPYDVESYGPSTSGIMFEAVAAARIVVVTRIEWAVQEYADHKNVVWLNGTNVGSLAEGLKDAVARVTKEREGGGLTASGTDQFKNTWLAALSDASRDPIREVGK